MEAIIKIPTNLKQKKKIEISQVQERKRHTTSFS